jgi:hypothetical protein
MERKCQKGGRNNQRRIDKNPKAVPLLATEALRGEEV